MIASFPLTSLQVFIPTVPKLHNLYNVELRRRISVNGGLEEPMGLSVCVHILSHIRVPT